MAAQTQDTHKINVWGYNTIAKQLIAPLILAALMFALAGTTDWVWGWVFSIVHFAAWLMMTVVLIRENPELLNARGRRRSDAKRWDMVILSIYGITWIVMLALGALDVRYGWTGPLPAVWHVVGSGLILAGFALTTWSMAVNRNFEPAVRIQQDRVHNVITGGPYRYMRHPGYTGVILSFFIGMPLALGSWPAALAGLVGIVVMVIRTALEDRTLQDELPGYADYARRTRFRLVPGVW